jgi:hypothetical protein
MKLEGSKDTMRDRLASYLVLRSRLLALRDFALGRIIRVSSFVSKHGGLKKWNLAQAGQFIIF